MNRSLVMVIVVTAGVFCAIRSAPSQTPPAAAPTPQPEPAPAVPLPPGPTSIFDGKSLQGWKQLPADQWTVRDGALVSLGKGRGVIATERQFGAYRIVFDVRHVSALPKKDHAACVLFFCSDPAAQKPADALAAIQFQVPQGGTWDYRPGHSNAGKGLFTSIAKSPANPHQWSRVEILIDSSAGTARLAVAQPPGAKATEIASFKDPSAGKKAPFALQMHNAGLVDEYANIAVEEEPKVMELITTK